MDEFPEFMRNPVNAISAASQSRGIEGYVFDGADGSQMAFWQCNESGDSSEHVHDFDEYFVVLQGQYTLIMGSEKIVMSAGQECLIPKGSRHAGEFIAGTRTIHAFGGKRAARAIDDRKRGDEDRKDQDEELRARDNGPSGQQHAVPFNHILDAFLWVSSAGYGINTAVLCKDTGEILYSSDLVGIDETEGKDLDPDRCVTIPHKNHLGLDQDLVFSFVEKHLPDAYERVRQIFRKRGAYGRFKELLDREGFLQTWYDFENEEQEWVLRRWCSKAGIQLSD